MHLAGNTVHLDFWHALPHMKISDTWCVKPCTMVEIYKCFKTDIFFYSEDGGSTILQNTGKFLPNYIALHPSTVIFVVTIVGKLKIHIRTQSSVKKKPICLKFKHIFSHCSLLYMKYFFPQTEHTQHLYQ
jgi:hypothetical protein